MIEMCDPYGWHEIDKSTLQRIQERISAFESMTWGEILVRDGKENHAIPVCDLNCDARNRLVELKQDDIDELVSLRFSARERIFGIREGAVLKLLWWDPMHLICPAPKKHT